MRVRAHGISRILTILIMVARAVTVFSFLVMWLWNWLMPVLFGLHAISYWQALGLLVLSKILFGSFGGRNRFRRDWRARLIRRWEDMTPEEREKVRAEMRGRCGPPTSTAEAPKP